MKRRNNSTLERLLSEAQFELLNAESNYKKLNLKIEQLELINSSVLKHNDELTKKLRENGK